MGLAQIPPNTCYERHTHLGIESAYVPEGEVSLKIDGSPETNLKAGAGGQIPAAAPHSGCTMAAGAEVLTVHVIEIRKAIDISGAINRAEEARAMLIKVIAALKADRDIALAQFNNRRGGFLDRDLYPFCVKLGDGKALAVTGPLPIGTNRRTLKDPNGRAFGEEMWNAYQKDEGQITEISDYLFPRLGSTSPVRKSTFVTRIGDLGCGVGYYK